MAKWEANCSGSFYSLLSALDDGILNGSVTASYEDGSDFSMGDTLCAVRVYERYSAIGGNRVSLSLTLFGRDGDMRLSAVTSGGSQAMFLKLNTLGEGAFLDCVRDIVERFERR